MSTETAVEFVLENLMRHARLLVSALLLAQCLGCESTLPVTQDRCLTRLAQLQPEAPRLAVGDTVTMTGHIIGPSACLPPGVTTATQLRWASGDTTIAVVDSVTGLLTARSPGQVGILAFAVGTSVTQALAITTAVISPSP
jgi:hypothetical protein